MLAQLALEHEADNNITGQTRGRCGIGERLRESAGHQPDLCRIPAGRAVKVLDIHKGFPRDVKCRCDTIALW